MATPMHAVTVSTYSEMREDINAFARGKYNFLMLLGDTGLGKTETVLPSLSDKSYLYIRTRASAYELYCMLYEANSNGTEFVVIDDVKDIFRSKDCVSLLTALTETKPIKQVSWHTAALSGGKKKTSDDQVIETTFYTSMRLIIIVNEWESLSEDVRALESRGVMLIFCPNAIEVHTEIARGGWYHDQEVYDFIFAHIDYCVKPCLRHYTTASEQRRAGRPWQKRLLEWICPNSRIRAMLDLINDPNFDSENKRAAEYQRRGYGSDRQYWRLKKEVKAVQGADRMTENLTLPRRD